MVGNDVVCLRPVERADLPLLERWANDPVHNSPYNTFGFRHAGLEQQFSKNGLLDPQGGTLIVVGCETEEVLGSVSYHRVGVRPQRGQPGLQHRHHARAGTPRQRLRRSGAAAVCGLSVLDLPRHARRGGNRRDEQSGAARAGKGRVHARGRGEKGAVAYGGLARPGGVTANCEESKRLDTSFLWLFSSLRCSKLSSAFTNSFARALRSPR